jgi:hypothetical protein
MKNKFYPLLLLCISMLSSQAAFYSHVTIYSEDHLKFTVYLNGEKKNDEPQERVRIINLTQSYYKIRVEFEDASIPPIERKIFQLTDGHGSPVDATHMIKKTNKGEYVMRWQSQTSYPGYIDDRPTVVVVNGGGNTVVRETTTTETQGMVTPGGVNMSFGVPGGSISINNGVPVVPAQTTTTTTTYSSSSPAPVANSNDCKGTILSTVDFSSALSSIKARSTEEGKLSSAKQILSSNCFAVEQVKQILKLFTTESVKLDLAKFAFDHTLDKGNYFKLNSEFKEESSIDELSKATTK